MPAGRTTIRRVREVLRLNGVPTREIARRIGVAPSTVRTTIKRLQAANLGWPLPDGLNQRRVAAVLSCGPRSMRRDGLELRLRVEEDDKTVFHVADQESAVEHKHKRENEVFHGH